eukprot:TRINITY_DN4183_c1_g1_i1.p1 TRINITY_DN4183_c1_g1~~TRINITY_DN4183_c1_g1_i1.p1  ORF type:complete len:361 (+),score=25.14 TRINITY_DN4183_c1_g1_i1:224-1306(+)
MSSKLQKLWYDLTHPGSGPSTTPYDAKDRCQPPDRVSYSESSSVSSEHEPAVRKICVPIHTLRQPPREEDYVDWPDAPVVLRPSSLVKGKILTEDVTRIPVNVHTGLKFETELFKGRIWFYVRGLETAPEDMFEGKKRRSHLVVQGQFKRKIDSSDLVSGQDFQRAAKNLPAAWLVDRIFGLIGSILGSRLLIGKSSERPFLMGSILTLAQAICVTPEGKDPPPVFPIVEDMRALGISELSNRRGNPVSSNARKHILQSQQIQRKIKFQPGQTWTFHIWQHLVDLSKYELNLLTQWDLTRYLDGQPIQFMAKDLKTGKYLWNFEVWHERLLHDAWTHHKMQQQQQQQSQSQQEDQEVDKE